MKSDDGSETERKLQRTCDMENFKMVAEHFNQDLREFWNRANFYLVTNAGLLSAFLIIYPTLVEEHLLIVILVPSLGIAIAVLWFLVLRGAFYWIEQWRAQMVKLSKELDRFKCYFTVEDSLKEHRLSSPSFLTKFMPIIFIFAWIAILAIVLYEIF